MWAKRGNTKLDKGSSEMPKPCVAPFDKQNRRALDRFSEPLYQVLTFSTFYNTTAKTKHSLKWVGATDCLHAVLIR